jgi:hypothetical protein
LDNLTLSLKQKRYDSKMSVIEWGYSKNDLRMKIKIGTKLKNPNHYAFKELNRQKLGLILWF